MQKYHGVFLMSKVFDECSPAEEKKTTSGPFWLIVRIVASIVLLALVLHLAGVQGVAETVKGINSLYLLPAIALVIAFKWLTALRLKLLVCHLGMTPTTWQVNRINFISAFYSLMLPGYLAGGAIRWFMLSRINQMPAQALAGMVYDRLGDTITLLGLGLLAFLLVMPPESSTARLTLSLVLFGLIAGYLMCANARLLVLLKRGVPMKHNRIGGSVSKLFTSFQHFADLRPGEHCWLWGWAIGSNLLNGFLVYCVALSLGLPLGYLDCLWIVALWILAGMLPISISGLGVREGATVVMLIPLGVSAAESVSFSLLLLVSRDVVMAGIGGLFLAATPRN